MLKEVDVDALEKIVKYILEKKSVSSTTVCLAALLVSGFALYVVLEVIQQLG